jgi:hypothetical protein
MDDLPRMALSIRQPWAWAILHAGKDVENRTWMSSFRGPVAIHAGLGMPKADVFEFSELLADLRWKGRVTVEQGPHYASLPRGGIVGVAEVTGCVNASSSPWFFGPFAFTLANARPVPFVPCRGALGFFAWKPEC